MEGMTTTQLVLTLIGGFIGVLIAVEALKQLAEWGTQLIEELGYLLAVASVCILFSPILIPWWLYKMWRKSKTEVEYIPAPQPETVVRRRTTTYTEEEITIAQRDPEPVTVSGTTYSAMRDFSPPNGSNTSRTRQRMGHD